MRRPPSRNPDFPARANPCSGFHTWFFAPWRTSMAAEDASAKTPDDPVTLAEATRVWAKIGWLGFGGPAGQIALMHRELVEKRRWISNERFLHALNYCMLLPGP